MTALVAGKPQITPSKWTRSQFTLASGFIAYHGGLAAVLIAGANAGKVVPATGASNERAFGKFSETVNASSSGLNADSLVTVEFPVEKTLTPVMNGTTTDAVAVGNIGQVVYALDDQTCTIVPNASPLGVFWGFDGSSRCLVELFGPHGIAGSLPAVGAALAFASNDCVLTASQAQNGMFYDVPTTAAASTVTLPTTGVVKGTKLTFVADGTKNGHTVQYRYGTTVITAALTASKIHRVDVTFNGTLWGATSGVSP